MKKNSGAVLWLVCDVIISIISVFFAELLDSNQVIHGAQQIKLMAIRTVAFSLPYIIFSLPMHIYKIMWKYAGSLDFLRLMSTVIVSTVSMYFICKIENAATAVTFYFIFFILVTIFLCVARLLPRTLQRIVSELKAQNTNESLHGLQSRSRKRKERVMIIGGGSAANLLIEDMRVSEHFSNSVPVCIIDDSHKKLGNYVGGVKVVGTRENIVECADKYDIDTIIFAVPSMPQVERASVLKICSETDCQIKSMPSINEAINNGGAVLKLRKVKIEDLLDRDPIKIDTDKIIGYVENRVVLVTGGGGSIGSELCRQIADHNPKKLIIFDVYENNAYDIQNELRRTRPEVDILTLIGSVRDSARVEAIFDKYRPEIVYHAAAHKHVPLMEDSPNEAIKNNVFGTYKTAQMADKYGCKKFVLISTDKAVNPTNVMGASKRMCEMVVQSFSRHSNTEFVAVRFGNVLGSNGSVIPLFKKQIESGGPVLVTHPDIIRYFMTIKEAVSLVLTAGAYAKGGEIFVLDMGKPVKIYDLAKNMIRLMGYKLGVDVNIEFSGLRPGEKLYEEMLMDEEGLRKTENSLIHIGNPIEFDDEWFMEKLENLKEIMYDDKADVRMLIKEIVPTYIVPEH